MMADTTYCWMVEFGFFGASVTWQEKENSNSFAYDNSNCFVTAFLFYDSTKGVEGWSLAMNCGFTKALLQVIIHTIQQSEDK